jgi:uncharacterized protein YuzE
VRITYSEDADALYVELIDDPIVVRTVDVDPGTLVDLNEHGDPVGIEVIHPDRDWPVEAILDRWPFPESTSEMLGLLRSGDRGLRRFAGRDARLSRLIPS